MPPATVPLTVYGGDDCDDTEHVVGRLREWGVPFREVILERDPDAERFVVFINGGYRSTPTLVFGDGKLKTVLTEPTDEELAEVLARAGYLESAADGRPTTADSQ
jgi:mycoredoxin